MMPSDRQVLEAHERQFDRLRLTSPFRGERFEAWRGAKLGVVGAGVLGGRFATEAVLSGATCYAWDSDLGEMVNQGTQRVQPGVAKVDSLVAACDAIRPGRAVGYPFDVRHAGVGQLAGLSVLVDASDDPALVAPLAMLSNGLGLPLLRLAVDGSGATELGRVQGSSGAPGGACPLCNYRLADLVQSTVRTPCPGNPRPERPPTLAGGAIASVIAGVGLLQAQRLVTGNDRDQVVDREIIVDLSHWALLPLVRRRSDACVSGHVSWRLARLRRTAEDVTLRELFAEARRRLAAQRVTLEPFAHAISVEATCDCGARRDACGTRWAPPPACPRCGRPMRWFEPTQRTRLTEDEAEALEIAKTPVLELGLPAAGAMFVARAAGQPPLRLLLDSRLGGLAHFSAPSCISSGYA